MLIFQLVVTIQQSCPQPHLGSMCMTFLLYVTQLSVLFLKCFHIYHIVLNIIIIFPNIGHISVMGLEASKVAALF